MAIRFFSQSETHREFSNFAPFPFDLDGLRWATTEHYYQAQKFTDRDLQTKIRKAEKPIIAKNLADKHRDRIRPDWDAIKDDVMYRAVRRKFELHPSAAGAAARDRRRADHRGGAERLLLGRRPGRHRPEQARPDHRAHPRRAARRRHRRLARQAEPMNTAGWQVTVLTIFPDMFPGPLGVSLAGRALAAGIWWLTPVDIRDFATDRHRTVDDTPAGGGPGMVMKADVLARALDAAPSDDAPSPADVAARSSADASPGRGTRTRRRRRHRLRPVRGRRSARDRGARPRGSLDRRLCAVGRRACRHGADRRLRAPPAGRHGQGGLRRRRDRSAGGLLEYPHYTRPQSFEGRTIPDILTSGDHAKIAAWRQAEAERLTRERRPDLWAARPSAKAAKKTGPDA